MDTPLHRIHYDSTMTFGSEHPEDPAQTMHVLIIILTGE
jgi:hypothetical protein